MLVYPLPCTPAFFVSILYSCLRTILYFFLNSKRQIIRDQKVIPLTSLICCCCFGVFHINRSATDTKNMPEKYRRRALDRESWCSASREPSDALPRLQPCTQTHSIYHTPYTQGFRLLSRHSRRRLGNPWIGPISAARKRLKLATVTPGATSTLSASSASLFLCRCLDAFYSSCAHAAINLQRPSCTMFDERLNNRFIHVGVDTSRYALLIGGRSLYPPCVS